MLDRMPLKALISDRAENAEGICCWPKEMASAV